MLAARTSLRSLALPLVRGSRAPPARPFVRGVGDPHAGAGEEQGAGGRRFPFPIWPGAGAALAFGATLFSSRYFSTDEIWKEVVQQLPKRDGLRTLQLALMLLGGRWTDEVRLRSSLLCRLSLSPCGFRVQVEPCRAASPSSCH